MTIIFFGLLTLVISGHFFFAYQQWFKWPQLCGKLTELTGSEIENTAFLGRSIASYNASIGVGLLLSLRLDDIPQAWVQGVTLLLITITAAVGAVGTKGNSILIARLMPAALALLTLLIFSAPS
jgi:uncharacterized membrane protein